MTISTKLAYFGGKMVEDWHAEEPLLDTKRTIYRISTEYDEDNWHERFAAFLDDPRAHEVTGFVAGVWNYDGDRSEAERMVEALVSAHDRLPNLTALFIGDITFEESEISWIAQTDLAPLLLAFPKLEYFGARGGNGLRIGTVNHQKLKHLQIESGGLPVRVVQDILKSHLPQLEHLEIWLGTENYGATTTLEDLAPLFTGALFPKLRYLGLRDSDLSDAIAEAITQSPLLERLETLDLSLGSLGDDGANALLNCPGVKKLKKLDVHHHYCSDEVMERLQQLGIEVDTSQQEDEEEYGRYVAVGE